MMLSNLYCVACKCKVRQRATYLFEAEQNGYLCKKCWHKKYDANPTKVELTHG